MRFLGLFVLIISLPALAITEITSKIQDVDYGRYPGEDTLLMLQSGHVVKIKNHKPLFSELLSDTKLRNKWFHFELDEDRNVVSIDPASSPMGGEFVPTYDMTEAKTTYVPTTIASLEVAQSYFRNARRTVKEETQCFNRAMVWTYEWWKKHSLKSNKLLVFFTRNYIRRYDFEWWFHIAPYVHVNDNGKVVERVMDVKYSSGPRTFRDWTNIFLNKDPECPVITKYSEYADHPYTGECYIMRTHMYTYQPADLQMYEAWGYKKDAFNMQEVKGAYLEAYNITL